MLRIADKVLMRWGLLRDAILWLLTEGTFNVLCAGAVIADMYGEQPQEDEHTLL